MQKPEVQKGKKDPKDGIRLNKYMSEAGLCSRREADRLIAQGKVTVDGKKAVVGESVQKGQKVEIEGKILKKETEKIILALNKPRGVVCTTDRRWDDRILEDILPLSKRVYPIGRLDKDSEGLLLMTNQGDILNKILKAGNAHEKEYLVTVDRKITGDFLKKIEAGVYLKELGVVTRPCRVQLAGEKQFRIILTQGLNRQIRRMCQAFQYNVVKLVRVRIMNIELGQLKSGEFRKLSQKEQAEMMLRLSGSSNHPDVGADIKNVTQNRRKRKNGS